MPVMDISLFPIGTKSTSLSPFIAESIRFLNKTKNVKYSLTPMGTIIESSSVDKLLKIAGEMHKNMLKKTNRVLTHIKIDDRKDKKITMESKIRSVAEKIK
ncbi:MAG: MTH1187 family thiamine-binding protein [Spirochaetes bacterium]|nr:MTH1187 family thiamine-binding protein [Spirochaetota bacterium]